MSVTGPVALALVGRLVIDRLTRIVCDVRDPVGRSVRLSEMHGPVLMSSPAACFWLKIACAASTARAEALGVTCLPALPQAATERARTAAMKAPAAERIAEVSRAP